MQIVITAKGENDTLINYECICDSFVTDTNTEHLFIYKNTQNGGKKIIAMYNKLYWISVKII